VSRLARPRKMNSEELVRIVNAYFTTEAAGNPALLKCSLLGKYADKVGSKAKAYDFRRDEQVRKRINELKEIVAKESCIVGGKGCAYKSLDISRILSVRHCPEELARVLGDIDQGWKKVYEQAVRSNALVTDFQIEIKNLRDERERITEALEISERHNKDLQTEKRRIVAENRYLRKMLKTYLYPALANEILSQEEQIQNPDTQVTEKAKEALIDGTLPSSISGVISRDMVEMKSVEDAVAVMWAGIGGQE